MSQVSFMERLPTITSSNACIMQAWCLFVFKQGLVLKVSIIACCSSVGVNEDHVVIQGEERSTMDAQEAGYSIPALKRQVGRGWWLQMVVCLLLSSESAPQLCNISGRFLESQNFFLGCSKFFFFLINISQLLKLLFIISCTESVSSRTVISICREESG